MPAREGDAIGVQDRQIRARLVECQALQPHMGAVGLEHCRVLGPAHDHQAAIRQNPAMRGRVIRVARPVQRNDGRRAEAHVEQRRRPAGGVVAQARLGL